MAERELTPEARAVASAAARASYGKLLSVVATTTHDIAAAEDALSEAFVQALRTWPGSGIPANPEGWLVAVARNRLKDHFKSAGTRSTVSLDDGVGRVIDELDIESIPDKRLELLFVCAHPAIDQAIRTPLMLQAVLGFEAAQVAAAFAVPTTAMAQRLVRAKRRIRDARIPFALPTRQQMPTRLPPVLEAVYGAYAIDWQVAGTRERESLASEALYLAVTLATLLDDEPEAHGLAALVSLSLSRAAARERDGELVPLDEQDTALWDRHLISQGEAFLRKARARGRTGRFQLEAAIQSVHCARAATGETDWAALEKLHRALVRVSPTLGARVSLAAVTGRLHGAAAGLAELDAIGEAVNRFQPAWATRAHLLSELDPDAAAHAFAKAISLTTDRLARAHLSKQAESLASQRRSVQG